MTTRTSLPLILLVLGLAACGSDADRSGADPSRDVAAESVSYTDIDATQLSDMMSSKDFLLVNVHIPYEGEIPGTDLNTPYNAIDEALDLLGDTDTKVVLYCRSGRMSTAATERLAELGYGQLYHLAGGMRAWTAAGFALEHSEGRQ